MLYEAFIYFLSKITLTVEFYVLFTVGSATIGFNQISHLTSDSSAMSQTEVDKFRCLCANGQQSLYSLPLSQR